MADAIDPRKSRTSPETSSPSLAACQMGLLRTGLPICLRVHAAITD